MFFGGRYYFNRQSNLDELFKKPNLTIEDILLEDNIVADVRMNQNKYAEFMLQNPHFLMGLVKHATREPSKDLSENNQLLFPYVASELLGIQIPKIAQFFFTKRPEDAPAFNDDALMLEDDQNEDPASNWQDDSSAGEADPEAASNVAEVAAPATGSAVEVVAEAVEAVSVEAPVEIDSSSSSNVSESEAIKEVNVVAADVNASEHQSEIPSTQVASEVEEKQENVIESNKIQVVDSNASESVAAAVVEQEVPVEESKDDSEKIIPPASESEKQQQKEEKTETPGETETENKEEFTETPGESSDKSADVEETSGKTNNQLQETEEETPGDIKSDVSTVVEAIVDSVVQSSIESQAAEVVPADAHTVVVSDPSVAVEESPASSDSPAAVVEVPKISVSSLEEHAEQSESQAEAESEEASSAKKSIVDPPTPVASGVSSLSDEVKEEEESKENHNNNNKNDVVVDNNDDDGSENVDTDEVSSPPLIAQVSEKDQPKSFNSVYGDDLLTVIFKFLEPDTELNSTSAGYFNKVCQLLISGSDGNLLNYLSANPHIVENILKHLYLKSVSKIVLMLLTSDGIYLIPDKFESLRVELIVKLHEKFRDSSDHEVLLNIQDILVQINTASMKPHSFETKRQLYKTEHIDILIDSITNHKESFSQAAFTLSSYLDHYRLTVFNEENSDSENAFDGQLNFGRKDDEEIEKEFPLLYLQQRTAGFIKALMEDNLNVETVSHQTQYGGTVQPYGLNRIKLLHLILSLIKTDSAVVNLSIIESKFFSYLLNLILKHEWNNILHNQIEQIFTESFKIAVTNEQVRQAILYDAHFLTFIATNALELKTTPGTHRKAITKGYASMLINFANKIEEQKSRESFEWLSEALNETPLWQEFVEGSLAETNKLYSLKLGNDDAKLTNASEEIDDKTKTIGKIFEQYFKSKEVGFNQTSKGDDDVIDVDEDDNSEDDDDDDDEVEEEDNHARNQEEDSVVGSAPSPVQSKKPIQKPTSPFAAAAAAAEAAEAKELAAEAAAKAAKEAAAAAKQKKEQHQEEQQNTEANSAEASESSSSGETSFSSKVEAVTAAASVADSTKEGEESEKQESTSNNDTKVYNDL